MISSRRSDSDTRRLRGLLRDRGARWLLSTLATIIQEKPQERPPSTETLDRRQRWEKAHKRSGARVSADTVQMVREFLRVEPCTIQRMASLVNMNPSSVRAALKACRAVEVGKAPRRDGRYGTEATVWGLPSASGGATRQLIYDHVHENPWITLAEISQALGIPRSATGIHLRYLAKKGYLVHSADLIYKWNTRGNLTTRSDTLKHA